MVIEQMTLDVLLSLNMYSMLIFYRNRIILSGYIFFI